MSSAFLDELHPTCMEAVAEQPILAAADLTYIGLASLLPARLQPLCSCAGLFFARVVCRDEKEGSITLEVAALLRYLNGDDDTYRRHVRVVTLTQQQCVLLLEWDRRLTAMPTCEIRELVEEHVLATGGVARRLSPLLLMQILSRLAETTLALYQQSTPTDRTAKSVPVGTKTATSQQTTENTSARQDLTESLTFEPTTVEVPLEVFEAAVRSTLIHRKGTDTIYRPSRLTVDRRLLQAALSVLKVQRKETENWARKREIKAKERDIREALALSDKVAPQIDYYPLYARGAHEQVTSYQVVIDVPSMPAA